MLLKSIVRDIISERSNGRKIGEILVDMSITTKAQVDSALKAKEELSSDMYFGEFLLHSGIITEEDLDKALKMQNGPGIASLLNESTDEGVLTNCEKYGISRDILIDRLVKKSGIVYVDLDKYNITEKMMSSLFNMEALKKNNVILFEVDKENNIWKFASSEIGDVTHFKSRTKAEGLSKGIKCEFYFAFDFEIQYKFEHLSHSNEVSIINNEDASAIEFVNKIICEGIQKGASDIHFEPRKSELRIRYRIDGLIALNEIYPVEQAYIKSVISRIKVMAGMDVALSRKPQDGIIKDFSYGNYKYDLRVSSIQVVHGEKVVMRIAPKDEVEKTFEELGFLSDDIVKLNDIIRKPNGILFIAGATGSGKTTTLYSIIDKLNNPDKNICTIEDPVEKEIQDVNQVQVTSLDGTTALKFADYLRAFLRQDPDIIVVGETRDKETAETSMRASLTGHFVITTIHTNSALETVSRMYNMGVDTFIFSATVEGLMSQRLVRKTCSKCAKDRELTSDEKQYLDYINNNYGKKIEINKVKEGVGCDECNGTGYKGRIVVAEIIEIDDEIRDMINRKKSIADIEKYLSTKCHRTMEINGLMRVADGTTTLKELRRIL